METIKNYLETMFRNLPDTDQVRKAKRELLQMMEDKFTELRNNGISENEAVGTVISEFGNLEDLAQDLGLETVLHENKENLNRRNVSFDEVKEYVTQKKSNTIVRALSVFFFITCVTPIIICDSIFKTDAIGLALMFSFIGAGIILSVITSSKQEEWKYIKAEPCSISQESIDYVAEQKKNFNTPYSIMHAIGILLCALCFIPCVIFDELGIKWLDEISSVFLFLNIGVGVGLLIYAGRINKTYQYLLNINSAQTIGGSYSKNVENKETVYSNKTIKVIMDVYWPTVTCVYLIWSFLTFKWHITWIIWPIAGVIGTMLKSIFGEEK